MGEYWDGGGKRDYEALIGIWGAALPIHNLRKAD